MTIYEVGYATSIAAPEPIYRFENHIQSTISALSNIGHTIVFMVLTYADHEIKTLWEEDNSVLGFVWFGRITMCGDF